MNIDDAVKEIKAYLRTFIDDNELQRLSAKLLKCWYDAMIEQGFTCDQALQILCANPQLIKLN